MGTILVIILIRSLPPCPGGHATRDGLFAERVG